MINEETSVGLTNNCLYLIPFLGMGAAGGVIRELNTKTFSWRELLVRAITGAFGAALAGLYLKHMEYPIEMQYAIAGAIGATACELIQAVQKWIIRKIGGGYFDNEENSRAIPDGMDYPGVDAPAHYMGNDIVVPSEGEAVNRSEKETRGNDIKHAEPDREGEK